MEYLPCCLAAVIALGGAACADTSRCDAALASIDRIHADARMRDAQIVLLRAQLATFAADLQARSAADRDLLLQRLAALQAENAALAQRLVAMGNPVGVPPVTMGNPVGVPQTPPVLVENPPVSVGSPVRVPQHPPVPHPPRQANAKVEPVRGIDEWSPY